MFAKMNGWDFLVVGDKKTPHDKYKNYNYLHPEEQEKLDKPLSDMIGWNCIQRRNLGFVYALKNGYDYIATVDDDNIPLDNWGEFFKPQKIDVFSTKFKFFDPLSVTNYNHLWHRGFPLQHVHKKNEVTQTKKFFEKFDVQANLWNGDPDIDAVCRMIYAPECKFTNSWYTTDCMTPFNSQNTILSKDALRHYFMFDKVGRMDDIFGSYILQKKGFKVVFGPPTVYQDRNEHDLTIDMKKEYIGYENVRNIIEDESFIPFDSYNRYREVVENVSMTS
jgi:hypothetical protein|tara:strand:- start:7413 stop:8243 length:831 start_codon:yes stop_codon:yes gene_type:complete